MHYTDNSEPWAEFEEIKDKKFTNFEQVKEQINTLTDKEAGTKGNIVNKPIKLRIYSKTCPDLTVIDLPGITRIPLHGKLYNF
jgi:vacuolar protein sorting-associated protein 1